MQNKIQLNLKSIIGDKKPHFLLAISGGIDSMVMFDCFKKMSDEYSFSVCHINHNYQDNSLRMEMLVLKSCGDSVDCIIRQISSNDIKSNIESQFRNLRYNTLERVRKKVNADYIVTAHHADDQAETILMKILNSSGFDGLEAIRVKNNNILRPMINISKNEINEYARQEKVEYLNDCSNDNVAFTRNFLRKEVFPSLKKVKKNIHLPFLDFSNRVKEVNELIDFAENTLYDSKSFKKSRNVIQIDREIFTNLPFLVQLRVVNKICYKEKINSFTKTNIREIKDFFIKNEVGSEKKINEIFFTIDRNDIIIFKSLNNNVYKQVAAGKSIENKDFNFSWNFDKKPLRFNNDSNIEYIDASSLKDDLVIRSVNKDDIFLPLGMQGSKKVDKFLKDKKIPSFKRKQSLVVCNSEEIIWVAGYQLSDKYKIEKKSKKFAKLNFLRN